MADWEAYLESNRDRFLGELLELLRIPSVSTDPAHGSDVARAARWTAARLGAAGIEDARVMQTAGHPVVYGDWLHAPGRPTVLFYGHFDVQPPDPLVLWTSPPFEPAVRDGRVYARGASDMKGSLLLPVAACEALLRTAGALPVNVRFLFEGEEEVLSPSLPAFVEAQRDLLACDLAVSADSSQGGEDQPVLSEALRGLCGVQLDVRSAATDLHSGVMGGIAPSAAHALIAILDSMRGGDGRVLVEGFYDDVVPPSPEERRAMAAVPDDIEPARRAAGIRSLCGEPGYTARERNWARPTLEVNGLWGGYSGEGMKTVIPCEAHAKVTCRLVADQRPERVLDLLRAHVRRHAPPEVDVSATPFLGRSDPYRIPADHPGMAAAGRVLSALYGRPPLLVRNGATVPLPAILRRSLGVYTVGFGFGLRDEHIHAPDEFIRLASLEKGRRAFCMLLEELGR